MLDKSEWYVPEFMGKPFQIVLKEADDAYSQYKAWKDNPGRQLYYWTVLEAYVDLLEHVTVFNKGLGYTQDKMSLIDRYKTFDRFKRIKC